MFRNSLHFFNPKRLSIIFAMTCCLVFISSCKSEEPVPASLNQVEEFTGIDFPLKSELVVAWNRETLQSGSGVYARVAIPQGTFSAITDKNKRLAGTRKQRPEDVQRLMASLPDRWKSKLFPASYSARLAAGSAYRDYPHLGCVLIVDSTGREYVVLWDYH